MTVQIPPLWTNEATTEWVDALIDDFVAQYERTGLPQRVNFRSLCAYWPWAKRSDVYTHFLHRYPAKLLPYIPTFFLSSSLASDDETILDPFAGTGMTGIAALKHGRRAILIDISPFATFLAYNHCVSVDLRTFQHTLNRIISAVDGEVSWLYKTICRNCGNPSHIMKTFWSEVMECPKCSQSLVLWDLCLDQKKRLKRKFHCPYCKTNVKRGDGKRLSWQAREVEYICSFCGRRTDPIEEFDKKRILEIEDQFSKRNIPYPDYIIPQGDMWRTGYHYGMSKVEDFYTRRNLWALGRLYEEIMKVKDPRLRSKLFFVFTNVVWHGSRMRRYNPRGGARPLNSTLYIPALSDESNVLAIFKHKGRMIHSFLREISHFNPNNLAISTQSATDLSNLPNDCIDYIFTDPPYGGNILYSEVNVLWEAWFGYFTDSAEEAVVSKYQKKKVNKYRDLLKRSFSEIFRVLKPGRYLTVTFNTSKRKIWEAFQIASQEAGFQVKSIQILIKGHKSFKQLTSRNIAGYDIIVSFEKPSNEENPPQLISPETTELKLFVRKAVITSQMDPHIIYAETIRQLMISNRLASLSYKHFLSILSDIAPKILDCMKG